MSKTSETIVKEIKSYISGYTGKYYSDYYAGITKDPQERLFSDHNVDKENGCWIFRKAKDIDNARNGEKTLLDKGIKGGEGGGDDKSIFVYCYQITNHTNE